MKKAFHKGDAVKVKNPRRYENMSRINGTVLRSSCRFGEQWVLVEFKRGITRVSIHLPASELEEEFGNSPRKGLSPMIPLKQLQLLNSLRLLQLPKEKYGLRSAIRYGEITAKEGLKQLRRKFAFIHPVTLSWFEQRAAKE